MTRLLHRCTTLALLALLALLAACRDGSLNVDLGADSPAEAALNVVVSLDGVALRREDGSEDTITLSDPVKIDLLDYDRSTLFQLIDNETLADGRYNGIRLIFSDSDDDTTDNYLVDANGQRRPVVFDEDSDDDFEPIALDVEKDDGKTFTVQIRLDLRLSLSPNDENRLMKPVLRAALDDEAATVSGSVPDSLVTRSDCRDGRNAGVGVAVYAFADSDKDPDDFDGAQPDPIATTPVLGNGSSDWTYTLRTMPPGEYTLAVTCDGDREDPRRNDDEVEFRGTENVDLDDGDDRDADF